ncbi:MAG TPA: OmpH family outer membrane protein [Tepidisphaeraceae bacterium]|jgi:Skp family chaperone for outer membrane proteins|nr:OmpH family outer membrane protein [Tepidisphaeraceae bacterium]
MRYPFICFLFLFGTLAHAEAPLRIGTCNVTKVFDSLDERKAVEMGMKSNATAHNTEVARRRKAIEDVQAQRDELKPESLLYQQKTEELVQAATQLEVMTKLKEMELLKLEKQHTARLYDQIRAACKQAAAAHQLDLVVAERPPEFSREMARLSPDQLRLLLSTSEVLYANNQLDLTEEITLMLNKQFATSRPAKP